MADGTNRKITLKSRPSGYPTPTDFEMIEEPIPQPGEGEVLVQAIWLSLDPYMRGRIGEGASMAGPLPLGEVMIGGVVGRIVKSRNPSFSAGEIVEGNLGWQEYATSNGTDLRRVDASLGPLSTALSVLGMTGMTAYFGFLDVCEPKPGDVVVVSAASGAVGQVVGQIAKIAGCYVVGTAGSQDKIDYIVKELGFDAGINYKTENIGEAIAAVCPNGIDVYFDNVGGPVTDAVMENLALRARIAICGQISQYNLSEPEMGPRNIRMLNIRQAKMEGFLVFQFANRHDEGRQRIAQWIREGKLKYREDIVEGIENAPTAFIGMLRGENFGKMLIKISDE
ncbi:MAG: NADP-dependent oxidoreductase [Chloroflexi bacterium]|nr:NADP-dependent oxidoreductase [Chloroflexota bacterium]